MKTIHRGNGFAVIEEDGKYNITWDEGPYGVLVSYEISREDFERAFKSDADAESVMAFAETGVRPDPKLTQDEVDRQFLRKYPELLVKNPEGRKLFSEAELKRLLKKAR